MVHGRTRSFESELLIFKIEHVAEVSPQKGQCQPMKTASSLLLPRPARLPLKTKIFFGDP
jgi:hypothetical protein